MSDAEDPKPSIALPEPPPVAPGEPAPEPAPRIVTQTVVRRGSFLGTVAGGVLAALAGYGAAQFVPQGWPLITRAPDSALTAQLDAQAKEIAALKQAKPAADPALEQRLAALETAPAPDLAPLQARLDVLDARLTTLEAAPPGSGVNPAALTALQAEVQALKAQAGGIDTAAVQAALAREVDAARAETSQLVAETRARIALGQMRAALDSGAPFAAQLPDLGEVPAALADHAATGLPTLPTLRATFPDAARLALEASLNADMGATWAERIGSFLKAQTGARSLEPREGGDPDAVLSRAEAALAAGDLTTALTELDALPDAGRTAIADWRQGADARAAGLAAFADLAKRFGE